MLILFLQLKHAGTPSITVVADKTSVPLLATSISKDDILFLPYMYNSLDCVYV